MDPMGTADPGPGVRNLVLYARVPRAGAVKTRLVPFLSAAEALALHRAFIHDSVALLRDCAAAGVRPVVAFSEPWEPEAGDPLAGDLAGLARLPQTPGDLGDRLEATLAALLRARHDRVVVIGSDSPDLPPILVDRAFTALERTALVLGPAADGGFHLIGSRLPCAGLLAGVAWGTSRALADVREAAARRGVGTEILEPWPDVDRPADLPGLAARLAAAPGRAPTTAAFLGRLARAGRVEGGP